MCMDIFHNPTHTICGQGNAYHDSNVYIYSGQINYSGIRQHGHTVYYAILPIMPVPNRDFKGSRYAILGHFALLVQKRGRPKPAMLAAFIVL